MEILKKITLALSIGLSTLSTLSGQIPQTTLETFKESYSLEADGEYTEALNKIREVYDEGSYEINARLGWLAYMSGLFTESIAYYQKAISLKPYALEPRFGIVNPHAAIGNWNMVMSQYEKILDIDPQNTLANYRLGMIYYGQEEYEKAARSFEKVINLYPFDYDSLLMYAWCHLQMSKLREAEVLFNKVLLIDPDNASALEGLELIQ